MAAVLSPKALSFPHNILHDDRENSYTRVERQSPQRPSLPSISSLISDIAKQNENDAVQRSPNVPQQSIMSSGSRGTLPPTPERSNFGASPKHAMPPTPPLPGASSFDFGRGRTPTIPCGSPMTPGNSQNGHSTQSPSTTNPEAYASHRSSYPPVPDMSPWHNPSSPPDSRRASREAVAELNPSSMGGSSYTELSGTSPTFSGLAQQRPLPVDFPPRISAASPQMPQVDSHVSTQQYQHHHHYPVTSPSAYPQATDRYQCPTCQKAFSRPSSLKIHTYSHTGEKPFKCKYEGCGKYFSVRSNMKRHEKGCHGADTSSAGGSSPKAA